MDARNSIILQPDTTEYPAILRRCEVNGRPPVVTVQGDPGLLEGKLLGFFCSRRCPGDIILKIYDLAIALRSTDVTLIGGFQSTMEKEFLVLGQANAMPIQTDNLTPLIGSHDHFSPENMSIEVSVQTLVDEQVFGFQGSTGNTGNQGGNGLPGGEGFGGKDGFVVILKRAKTS